MQGRQGLRKLSCLRNSFDVQYRRELMKGRAGRQPDSFGTIGAAQCTIRKILSTAAQRPQSLRQLHRNMRLNHDLTRLGCQRPRKDRSRGGESTNLNARLVKNARLLKNARECRCIRHTSSRQGMPGALNTHAGAAVRGNRRNRTHPTSLCPHPTRHPRLYPHLCPPA